MHRITKILLPVVLISFVLAGCGGGVDENKPIAQVKTEAQGMSVDQIKATVAKYQAAIQSKKAEIDKLAAKLQKIPVAQMMGDEAKKIKSDLQNVSTSIKALAERLNVYAQTLKSKM